jgi:integrase/recombinase XerD
MPRPPSSSQQLPRYLTQAETRAFFGGIKDLRDLVLFALIYHYGLRVGEVALLRRADVDLERFRIVVKRLKGGAWTEQPLFTVTARLLRSYLAGTAADENGPLLVGRAGPLKKRQIQTLFARYRERAGLSPRFTCHCLRHSIATHLLDAGVSLEFVQDHLGHQSIRSTSIYARITDHHRTALFRQLETSPWIVQPQGDEVGETPPPLPKAP